MFRSRFSDVFPTKLQNIGPQDIERGVVDPLPTPVVESLLCALLGLVLNRKKYVELVPRAPTVVLSRTGSRCDPVPIAANLIC
jgi:hypothetical protein